MDLGNGFYKTGTGILIGSDLVLTVAHNVYDYDGTKEKYANIVFIPGINEEAIPFGKFNVIESYVPDKYLETWKQEDYALLVVDGNPGSYAGYFGLHVAEKDQLKRKELHVIGYPGYVRTLDERNKLLFLSGEGRHQMWGAKGTNWFFDDGKNGEFHIGYRDILTTGGQSGSGVFYQEKGTNEYYVIGVHVLGRDGVDAYNSATWITRERFYQIQKWVGQFRKNLISREIDLESRNGRAKMKNLNLQRHEIGDVGVDALSEATIPKLECLVLNSSKITTIGAKLLSERTNWPVLKEL